jgi:hypothetical protein
MSLFKVERESNPFLKDPSARRHKKLWFLLFT